MNKTKANDLRKAVRELIESDQITPELQRLVTKIDAAQRQIGHLYALRVDAINEYHNLIREFYRTRSQTTGRSRSKTQAAKTAHHEGKPS